MEPEQKHAFTPKQKQGKMSIKVKKCPISIKPRGKKYLSSSIRISCNLILEKQIIWKDILDTGRNKTETELTFSVYLLHFFDSLPNS